MLRSLFVAMMVVFGSSGGPVFASHGVEGHASWSIPWYAIGVVVVVPYVILLLVGRRVYRYLRERDGTAL